MVNFADYFLITQIGFNDYTIKANFIIIPHYTFMLLEEE